MFNFSLDFSDSSHLDFDIYTVKITYLGSVLYLKFNHFDSITMKFLFTRSQLLHTSRTLLNGPRAPFKTSSNGNDRAVTFEKNMPFHRREKRWEKDRMDKDEWFRKKYAWKHAEQKKEMELSGHVERRNNRHTRRIERSKNAELKREVSQMKINPLIDYIYGTNPVLAALRSTRRSTLGRLYLHNPKSTPKIREIIGLAGEKGIKVVDNATKQDLNQMTSNGVHNGVVLESRPIEIDEIQCLAPSSKEKVCLSKKEFETSYVDDLERSTDSSRYPLGIYLDEISDPHNVGAILRSAYFLGVDFIVLSSKNCAALTPLVSKASSGAMEFLPIYSAEKPLKFFDDSTVNGWDVVSAIVPSQTKKYSSKAISQYSLGDIVNHAPTLIVVGSEGSGIRKSLIDRSVHVVGLEPERPDLDDSVDSLNVSVATALLIERAVRP